jgi:hypothetical protein
MLYLLLVEERERGGREREREKEREKERESTRDLFPQGRTCLAGCSVWDFPGC